MSAQARIVHVFSSEFGSEGSGPDQFKEPVGVAVNSSTEPLVESAAGDVYVVDKGDSRVERFSSSGVYLGEFDGSGTFEVEGKIETSAAAPTGRFSEPTKIAVDNSGDPLDPSAGDVYVVDSGNGVIDKFTETGAYIGQLTGRCAVEKESSPCPKGKEILFARGESGVNGIAVDLAGVLWVDEHNGTIDDFTDVLANEYISTCETKFGTGTGNLAVDSEDNLYLSLGLEGKIKVNALCETVDNPFGDAEPTLGIAVDITHGEVFIDYNTSVGALTLAGEEIERFGSTNLPVNEMSDQASKGVAVNASDGTVYATDVEDDDVVVFDAVTLPSVSVGSLSQQTPRSVTLKGTVNPEDSVVTSCEFEYVLASEFEPGEPNPYKKGAKAQCEPAAGALGSGSSPVPVSAHLTGLLPEREYVYRLVAENGLVHIPSPTPNERFVTGPIFDMESVSNVASESVTLHVSIDPNGDDTQYYFQIGQNGYEHEVPVSAPGVDLGSVSGVQNISVHVQKDLAPGVTYHYRTVVLQGGEEFFEPDRVFTMQRVVAGPVLPDGRAWELVSPTDKKGALIEPFSNGVGDDIQAAENGSGITYLSGGPALGGGAQGKINWAQTLSVRRGGGWVSSDLTVPRRTPGEEELAAAQAAREEYDLFSPDLSLAIVEPLVLGTPPLSEESPRRRTIYLRNNHDEMYKPLVWAGNVANPEGLEWGVKSEEQLFFVTATADLSHVLLASPFAFTPEAVYEGKEYLQHSQWNLYEWSAGELQLVNILPESEGATATRGPEPSVRLADGAVKEGNAEGVIPSAISSDGRRVAWDLGVPGISGYEGFFVRDTVAGSTVKVGGPESVFQWMSSDGSKVFFMEKGNLRLCGIVETGGEISCDYSELTSDFAAGESDAGVQRLVSDVSSDGSYVYFVATGVLGGTSGAVSGGDNLYLLHDVGGAWSTTFIATLGSEDAKSWDKHAGDSLALVSDLSGVSSRVSPDGRFLAFMSDRPLTGYDNRDVVSGRADEEVYLFDALSGRLVCASCDPTGARPVGVLDQAGSPLLVDRAGNWVGSSLGGSIPGWDKDFTPGGQYQPRYLSDSGRLFFDSADPLVPRATNGVENVYEFEPVGVGGCVESDSSGTVVFVGSSDGCVGLISSGISSQESAFFDASENGDDSFFITVAKLVGTDYDNSYDVYDAHVCGSEGVACVSEPVSSPACSSGDSCKAAPSPQPEIFGPAPSATFSGVGNVVEETKPKAKAKTKTKPKTKGKKKKKRVRKKKGKKGEV